MFSSQDHANNVFLLITGYLRSALTTRRRGQIEIIDITYFSAFPGEFSWQCSIVQISPNYASIHLIIPLEPKLCARKLEAMVFSWGLIYQGTREQLSWTVCAEHIRFKQPQERANRLS